MNKDFIKQRISIFAGADIDPSSDSEVIQLLQRKFDIFLPQRSSLDEALLSTKSSHEIIDLIVKYRLMEKPPNKRQPER